MTQKQHSQCILLRLSLAAAGMSPLACAEELLFSLAPSSTHFELGSAFASAGDLDADGVIDVAIADRSASIGSFIASGIVHIVSGADGSPIRDYIGVPAAFQSFGASMVALNADGDGIPDLAVGAPGETDLLGTMAGSVRIYSGSSGALLASAAGPASSQLGMSLANAGDQNGDGLDDLYAGAPNGNSRRGIVRVLSGADGSVIREMTTTASTSSFGLSLAALGDVDGDGRLDLAVGAPGFRVSGNQAGRVVLIRSSDGAVAKEVIGSGSYNRLGESLAAIADQSGDGLPDLMVGSYSGGRVLVVSGADFTTIKDLSIPSFPAFWPVQVGGSLDFDSDGEADFLIGSPGLQTLNNERVGGIRIVSGVDQSSLFELVANGPFSGLGTSQTVLPGLGFAVGEPSLADPVTTGTGYARVWQVEEVIPDSDGDGIPDDVDLVPNSVMGKSVLILGMDSGVSNRVDAQGVSLADLYAELGDAAEPRPAHYLVKVVRLSNQLVREQLIDRREASKIVVATVRAIKELKVKKEKKEIKGNKKSARQKRH